jgi:hypothetical protein
MLANPPTVEQLEPADFTATMHVMSIFDGLQPALAEATKAAWIRSDIASRFAEVHSRARFMMQNVFFDAMLKNRDETDKAEPDE